MNPNATTTSPRVRDVLVHALADALELEQVTTQRRGHAVELGRRARAEGFDVVVTLGGDGTINETVNGMLADGPGIDVPLLATMPGGSANVFARSLGLPTDPVEATGVLLEALEEGRWRSLGLGQVHIDERAPLWFLANAGLGMDAEIIEAMEVEREAGKEATPGRYLRLTIRQYFRHTDRKEPALRVERPGAEDIDGVFVAIVQNTSPWTFLGERPIDPCPQASFDTGLDLFAVRSLGAWVTARAARRMLRGSTKETDRGLALLHDQAEFVVRAARPTAVQVDGESLGRCMTARFTSHASAIRALA